MTHYIHHVPGRLRIRTLAIKRNASEAGRAKAHLRAIKGVTDTDVNTVTGSVVIKYDPAIVASTTLLESLRGLGYIAAAQAPLSAPSRRLGENLSEKIVEKLAEKVIERSALALLAALI